MRFELDTTNRVARLTQQATCFDPRDTVAFNWHVTDSGSFHCLWHTGGTFGFSNYIIPVPEKRFGIILLANESDAATQTRLADWQRRSSNAWTYEIR